MHASRHIENLIYSYAEHIDKGNLEAVAELFREGEILAPASGRSTGLSSGNSTAGYEAVLAVRRQLGWPVRRQLSWPVE